MFSKLRNKLILINLGITSVVIISAFTAIYLFSTRTAENRPMGPENVQITVDDNGGEEKYSESVRNFIIFSMREERKSAASTLLTTLVISGIALEIVVALISYFLAEQAIRPVRKGYEAQRIFIANASHEIKTPLAAIAANLEAADIHGNRFIDNVEYETAKLTALNSELLSLARTDLVTEVTAEETNLTEIIQRAAESFKPRMNGKKFKTEIELPKKVKVNVADFEQILSILLDNAVKYSDKLVELSVKGRTLVVRNDGKKIARSEITQVFDRFYQADKSAEGVGLGLSIAKSLAERNHWKLSATSEEMTIFRLDF